MLNRVLLTMIEAPFGIVWTLVGAATPFSTWSLTRPPRGRTGHRAFHVVGALGNAGRLRVLEHAGLIERRRTAQQRPSRLRPVALKDASEWLDTYRAFWEAGFDRMQQRLGDDG
jgi:hypothetical protein